MKILCISDYKDHVVYSNRIEKRFKDVDFVLSSGDLDLNYYNFIISHLNKPLFFVFGNHNLEHIKYYRSEYADFTGGNTNSCFNNPCCGATYVGGKVKKYNNVIIAGLGGSMRYNKGLNQFTEIGMFIFMLRLIPKLFWNKLFHGRYLDILLTHASPRGIHDNKDRCHTGFKVFLWFMKTFKPKYLIHGHIHLYDMNKNRMTKYHDTLVINAYKYFVLDTEVNNG